MINKQILKKNIEFYTKNQFFYIDLPCDETKYTWKERNGNLVPISTMSKDYLMFCIKLVEIDIKWMNNAEIDAELLLEIKNTIIPLANEKIKELELYLNK